MKKIVSFLKSRYFIKNLILAGIVAIVFIAATLLIINIYTHHGDEIELPDFQGMTVMEMRNVIEENNLRFEIMDSIFSEHVPKGTVAEQNPPPGFKVKRKRTVFFTINAFNPEMVLVPNVTEEASLTQAKSDLAAYGLKIGKLKYVNRFYRNYVKRKMLRGKEIEAGTKVPKGTRIDLEVGAGFTYDKDAELYVPNFYTLTLDAAYDKATDAYLNIGEVVYDGTVKTGKDSISAVVYNQEPYINFKTKELGMNVKVWLTTNKAMATEAKVEAENAPPPVDSTKIETDEAIDEIF